MIWCVFSMPRESEPGATSFRDVIVSPRTGTSIRMPGASLPETERLTNSVMCLPTGSTLQSADITGICTILRLALDDAAELRPILSGEPQWLIMKDEEKR